MGRIHVPTNVLKLRGSLKKHPERRDLSAEPKPTEPARARPPTWMTKEQKAAWKTLKDDCPPGVLTGSDAVLHEMGATLYAQYRANPDEMPTARMNVLVSVLARFGLTPADRSKIGLPTQERNEFDDL